MSVNVFGIRHHGPGCARSLLAALRALSPQIILVEGPPDAEGVLPLLAQDGMAPPVALLIYPPDDPQQAVFFPFATFSPEWQALRYSFENKIPARFIDLPQTHRLALEREKGKPPEPSAEQPLANPQPNTSPDGDQEEDKPVSSEPTMEDDPLGALALAAGYHDRELWWEHQIEQRQDPAGLFEGIMEAITALRSKSASSRPYEKQREAYMRQSIRAALKEGFDPVAVVCGAWHAPALADLKSAGEDRETLKGLPKIKVQATWVPWTYSRLSYRSGYGAGVSSPGWYDHLWNYPTKAALRWSILIAHLLRQEGLDASSASVIETVRLAETLAALRALPMAGLAELNEAALTVLCFGDHTPMRLIHDRLEVGDRLGEVPKESPAVPLQRDLESKQKSLRLKPTTEIKTLDLDLRNDTDRSRNRLLHQLLLLGIGWGQPQKATGKAGTFHEIWHLQWQVEFVVTLIEASVWGNSIDQAASASACDTAKKAIELPILTGLLDRLVAAGLVQAIDFTLIRLQTVAAVASDVRHLMDALPALARVARYGDVRGTSCEQIAPIINGLFERIIIGLPCASASLDDEAAARMVTSIGNVQQSLDLLDIAEQRAEWRVVLQRLLAADSIHGFVRGFSCRLLLEQGAIEEGELQRLAGLALSPAVPVMQAAAWIEGLLRGSGLVLLHQDSLWCALDRWLSDITSEVFIELLPVLRRAFAGFQPPERRAMAEKVKKINLAGEARKSSAPEADSVAINRQRADQVLPVLAHVLGVNWPTSPAKGDPA
jgi:hypothetical protein